MKKLLWCLCVPIVLSICSGVGSLSTIGTNTIYTEKPENVVVDEFVKKDKNPIRQGIDALVSNIGGIFYPQEIDDFGQAKRSTLGVVTMFINYALSLVSLVALIYLIVHGVMILTAMEDEAKYKKGLAGVKTAGIALAGIALSWLIVTLIFYVIRIATSG